jgi:type I restriction enzyme M protein
VRGEEGGQFYTPRSVVQLLVEMIEPYNGRIYDPCCGSGGMFVQSEKFVEAHGGRIGDLSIYGQESNPTTWKLCKMNLAIRGIDGNLGTQNADSFHLDLHKDLKADFILANPPFNMSDWGGNACGKMHAGSMGHRLWAMPTMPG